MMGFNYIWKSAIEMTDLGYVCIYMDHEMPIDEVTGRLNFWYLTWD
jgi:hypothetical protein